MQDQFLLLAKDEAVDCMPAVHANIYTSNAHYSAAHMFPAFCHFLVSKSDPTHRGAVVYVGPARLQEKTGSGPKRSRPRQDETEKRRNENEEHKSENKTPLPARIHAHPVVVDQALTRRPAMPLP